MTQTSELPGVAAGVTAEAFEPRPRDWQYLVILRELLHDRGRITVSGIATRLGVTHQAVSKMRNRPGFDTWIATQLRAGREERFEQLFERNWSIAMQGSPRHSEWCAKILGKHLDRVELSGNALRPLVVEMLDGVRL